MAILFNDKVVIVTGSGSGIGKGIALLFASRGAKVTLCDRDHEDLRSAFDEAVEVSGGYKDRFFVLHGDLNDQEVRKEVVEKTVEKFGSLDVLVANAGVSANQLSVRNATEESYGKVMDTNVKSTFFLIQQAVPHLEKSRGNVIITSSDVTSMINPLIAVYSMSKAALDHLTQCLAVDLGSKGIRVNSVNPGYIKTKIGRDLGPQFDKIADAMVKIDSDKIPLKGRILTVNDIAEAVLFLASDAAGFITGEHLKVDGGRSFSGPVDISVFKPSRNV